MASATAAAAPTSKQLELLDKVVETFDDHEVVADRSTGVKRKRRLYKDVSIENIGTKIVLPEGMETGQAIDWLFKKLEQEEEQMAPNLPIACYPFDGLVAFGEALREVFGYASYKPIRSFFGTQLPQFVSVPISTTETIECPIGQIHIPGIAGHLKLNAGVHNKKPCLMITGAIKNKDFPKVKMLADKTQEIIKQKSIYRGQAIQLGMRREERALNEHGQKETARDSVHNSPPTFLRVDGINERNLVLPTTLADQVKCLLWAPIEQTDVCRGAGVPLKRGVLLSGAYGTGKSLTGAITMKKAVDNKWTFISLADPDMLAVAIEMAEWYQPAVIFAEDVDQVIGTSERTADVNTILNVVDGIDKNKEIMVVVTTNHVERINVAMLRPGRLDAIIQFLPPDPEASERLLRLYGQKLISANEDISAAARIMAGAPASMVREVVERAKLAAISRSGSTEQISGHDLSVAASNIQDHLRLMRGAPNEVPIHPAIEQIGKSFGKGIAEGVNFGKLTTEQIVEGVKADLASKQIGTETAACIRA